MLLIVTPVGQVPLVSSERVALGMPSTDQCRKLPAETSTQRTRQVDTLLSLPSQRSWGLLLEPGQPFWS